MDNTLYCLAGPTAVGKTELSLCWAELYRAEILYCDAVSMYRGMDIGAAKPTAEEQARVPHHGLDLSPASEPFTVADYMAYAAETIRAIHARGNRVLISGGSGFYLKSFFAPVVDDVSVPPEIRQTVRDLESAEGLSGMVHALRACSPQGTGNVDLLNPRRVSRALERCLASGLSVAQLEARFAAMPIPFDAYPRRLCVLMRNRDELRARAALRARKMLADGLIEEVRQLRAEGLEQNVSAASAIGYREVLAWLDHPDADMDSLAAEIALNTNKLIKKQISWFRNQLTADRLYEMAEGECGQPEELFPQP